METKLKRLFDYQKFEGNSKLAALIAETESRCAQELSDDDLDLVNAAGEFDEQRLTTAPELPASTLSPQGYNNMFTGAKGLDIAPDLPATQLEKNKQ